MRNEAERMRNETERMRNEAERMRDEAELIELLEIEAAPEDITIHVEGVRRRIDVVNQEAPEGENWLALYTDQWQHPIQVAFDCTAIAVNREGKVTHCVHSDSLPGENKRLKVDQYGYVLLACSPGGEAAHYLKEQFKIGDTVKLRRNGQVVTATDMASGHIHIVVNHFSMITVARERFVLNGRVEGLTGINVVNESKLEKLYQQNDMALELNGKWIDLKEDGSFSCEYSLERGVNFLNLCIKRNQPKMERQPSGGQGWNGEIQAERSLIVYRREAFCGARKVILWVDQTANARRFQTGEDVRGFLQQVRRVGITDVVLDVKGVEGFVSYKRNDLTGRPYVSEVKAPTKAGASPDLDLLEEFIRYGHAEGLQIHASVNVFAEGSLVRHEFAVLDRYPDWEQQVLQPEDDGQIRKHRESARPGPVLFSNPCHDQVRQEAMAVFEEILRFYDVDGIVLDRGRFDNETADFSLVTRKKFEAFLHDRGKLLTNWPGDVWRYEEGQRIDGSLLQDWWEFRSGIIQSFFAGVRELVETYKGRKNRHIQMSVYVGSWYETYYKYGANWASPAFRPTPGLELEGELIYTPGYCETGYLRHLDFIMIGAYQSTIQEIMKYVTLGNMVTKGEIPLYAGIALPNVQDPALLQEVFRMGMGAADGLMLFDASHMNPAQTAEALTIVGKG